MKSAPATNGAKPVTVNGKAAPTGYTRANPYAAPVKSCANLNGPESAKRTTHVVIDLAGSGLSYEVGDSLGVYPTNCPELVEQSWPNSKRSMTPGAAGATAA